MAEVPVTIVCMVYPRDKSIEHYPATLVGYASITGLGVGGGPILPPDQVPPVEPPLEIWPPGSGIDMPEHPIVIPPPDLPPISPPDVVQPPHEGWNWSATQSGWYFLYIPRPEDPQPKRPGKK